MFFVAPIQSDISTDIFIDREILHDTPSTGFLSWLSMNKLPEVQLSVIVTSVNLSMQRFARGMRKYNLRNVFK